MKKKYLLSIITLFSAITLYSQQFWVVTNASSDIYTVNVSDGSIVSSVTTSAINIAQNPIFGFQGMAEHPITGEVYVLFKDNLGDKYIGSLNTSNGEIITVAPSESSYSSIAFDASGILHAKIGAGSQELVTVVLNTAPETEFHTYTNTGGGDMNAIGFNTTDNLMYRFTANDANGDGEFVSLDLVTLQETVSSITSPSSTGFDTYGGALAYRQGQNKFLVGAGNTLYDLLADGTVSTISSIAEFDSGTYNGGWEETYIKGLLNAPNSGEFWVVTNASSDIYTVNVSDGSIVSSVTTSAINIAQNPIFGFQGMAEHPITGEVYVLFKDNLGDKYIGSLNTSNGEIITVAPSESSYSSIAFDASGILHAKIGAGSQELVTVVLNTAPETEFHTYTNTGGGDMNAIGFNTTDNLMYRFTANDANGDGEFVSLDLVTLQETVSSITSPSSTGFDTYGGALAYRQGQNKFLVGAGNTLYDLLADGTVSTISSIAEFDSGTYNGGWEETYIKGLLKFSSSTAGVNDLTKMNISIYPNPTNNIINVNLGELTNSANYALYSINGKMIGVDKAVYNNNFTVDLTNVATGVYILKIKSDNSVNTFKIIKK